MTQPNQETIHDLLVRNIPRELVMGLEEAKLVGAQRAYAAARGMDDVDRLALRDRLVRAGRFTDVAVDAQLVDQQGHTVRRTSKGPSGWPEGPGGLLGFDEDVLATGGFHQGLHAGAVGGLADEQHLGALDGVRGGTGERGDHQVGHLAAVG